MSHFISLTVENSEGFLDADCIITAAGLSSRMGEWKMILPYRDGTILDASIKNALSICRRVILVTGFRGQELQQKYQHMERLTIVDNPDYQMGLFSSIQCGVARVVTDNFFITHGDMPCLSRELFQKLWFYRGEKSVFPSYQDKMGHPVLLSATRIADILAADKNSRMRALLLQREYLCIPVGTGSIYRDVDTPAEYHQLLSHSPITT